MSIWAYRIALTSVIYFMPLTANISSEIILAMSKGTIRRFSFKRQPEIDGKGVTILEQSKPCNHTNSDVRTVLTQLGIDEPYKIMLWSSLCQWTNEKGILGVQPEMCLLALIEMRIHWSDSVTSTFTSFHDYLEEFEVASYASMYLFLCF